MTRGKKLIISPDGLYLCASCEQRKPLDEFAKDHRRPLGRRSYCYECHNKDSNKGRYKSHREPKESYIEGLYVIEMNGVYKIGFSKNVYQRANAIIQSLPFP